jgi:hypothetical protein
MHEENRNGCLAGWSFMHAEPIPSVGSMGIYPQYASRGPSDWQGRTKIKGDGISMGYRVDLASNPIASIEESMTSCLLFSTPI